jgi:hypothetical protein
VLIWGEALLVAAVVVDEVVLEDGSADVADAIVGDVEDNVGGCELDG